jgi:hypothetical protein
MADRPIIFSAPMVRALLDGRKTQTRRVLKPQPGGIEQRPLGFVGSPARFVFTEVHPGGANWTHYAKIPYAPGDRLWVRETWRPHYLGDGVWNLDVSYPADGERRTICDGEFGDKDWNWPKAADRGNVTPLHMPRWASRLTLTVTDVRVQRLQEISEADCYAEGIENIGQGCGFVQLPEALTYSTARGCYHTLWNSLHGPGAWGANPWVVALTFTVQRGNIDQLPGVAG